MQPVMGKRGFSLIQTRGHSNNRARQAEVPAPISPSKLRRSKRQLLLANVEKAVLKRTPRNRVTPTSSVHSPRSLHVADLPIGTCERLMSE